jgi:hypothetical protein
MPKDWKNTEDAQDPERIARDGTGSSERLTRAVQGFKPSSPGLTQARIEGAVAPDDSMTLQSSRFKKR